jgi:DNA (cytosine-5)-methyltransferase 1
MKGELVMANRANNVPRAAGREPAPPVLTGETLAVVHMRGVVELQRHGDVADGHTSPVHTIRAGGQHHALIMRNNTARGDQGQMVTPEHEPMRTLTTSGTQSVIFMPYTRTGAVGAAAHDPVGTLTTRDRLALVVPAGGGWADTATAAAREPLPTQTATECRGVVWGDDDIDACRFRMFALHEIAGAMVMHNHVDGEPYQVLGNKRERMAQYGNSVTPPAMAWLIARLADTGVDIRPHRRPLLRRRRVQHRRRARRRPPRPRPEPLAARRRHANATNFQHADHDCEDISSLSTRRIKRYLRHARPTMMIGGPECTNHSIAKGSARRKPQAASLFDDGPGNADEQDKSRATMWDIARFAEEAIIAGSPLQAIVVENVVDAFKWGAGDDGGLFNAWLMAIDGLGYTHEIVWLNSMFAPPSPDLAPQSRDRMYVVFWLRGRKPPQLRVEPPSWCPRCEEVVHGQQTWKKPDARPWGRYGPQYFYACACPDCRGVVLPGAAPAASIIDGTLPAQVIGERDRPLAPNTRERIRRGLERLSNEPFAIRLTHGGVPRPLTLPLVTLTQRHDPAVVFPVSGNTYETSSGNRARRAAERPLDTIHGTLDRAIVIPPMGNVDARPAATLPAPTQTTTTRAGLVTTEMKP